MPQDNTAPEEGKLVERVARAMREDQGPNGAGYCVAAEVDWESAARAAIEASDVETLIADKARTEDALAILRRMIARHQGGLLIDDQLVEAARQALGGFYD